MSVHYHKSVPPSPHHHACPTTVKHCFIPHRTTSSGAANVTVLRPVPFTKCVQATIQRCEPPSTTTTHTHTHPHTHHAPLATPRRPYLSAGAGTQVYPRTTGGRTQHSGVSGGVRIPTWGASGVTLTLPPVVTRGRARRGQGSRVTAGNDANGTWGRHCQLLWWCTW